MMALLATVLIASLVGSLHCAGMCGAFVAFAIGAGDPAVKTGRSVLLAAYQAGRLVTYMGLGAMAGFVGAGLDLGGNLVGLQRTAAVLAGVMMVGFGVMALLAQSGVRVGRMPVPVALGRLATAGNLRARGLSPVLRAGVTGLLTTLLPCGWLYAFVITAAGTGSILAGAAVMGVFWAGTLPVLTVVGVGVRKLAGPLAARLPAATACMVVVVGLYTIVARAGIVMHGSMKTQTSSTAELARQVRGIEQEKLPCCTQGAEVRP